MLPWRSTINLNESYIPHANISNSLNSPDAFKEQCANIFGRMMDTVPANVVSNNIAESSISRSPLTDPKLFHAGSLRPYSNTSNENLRL